MPKTNIKTRFAPSPTGALHMGSLRTALYNYAYAKNQGGEFILRIEDTDTKRFVEGSAEELVHSLQEIGIAPDLFPSDEQMSKLGTITGYANDWAMHLDELENVIDDDYDGVYIQSQRISLYQKYAWKLIQKGLAYFCFCTEEMLKESSEKRKQEGLSLGYDGFCRNIELSKALERINQGEKYVVRLNINNYSEQTGKTEIVYHDRLLGEMTFPLNEVNDQVLIKSNGIATYHLAVVVDDHLMGITHPFRAWEWIPSTPKQIIIYEGLGWKMSPFAHLTAILDPNSGKLLKRSGSVFVTQFLDEGYLPEAILNFLMLLGWSPGNDREIFNLKEFANAFFLVFMFYFPI